MHLAYGGVRVGEELQPLLAGDDVGRAVGKVDCVRGGKSPIAGRGGGPRRFARATSTIAGVTSRPTTRPAAPRTGAAKRTTIPVPQATSRSVSPGCRPRRIRRVIAQGANKRGTRMSSYISAELELPNPATKLSACPPVLVTPRTVPPKAVRHGDNRAMVRCGFGVGGRQSLEVEDRDDVGSLNWAVDVGETL